MKVIPAPLPGVLLIEPRIFGDERGYLFETFNERRYAEAGIVGPFVQDNLSRSTRGVLRGLHFQHPHGQAKLASVIEGEVFDVVVDVRLGSPTFGRWHGVHLSEQSRRQLYVPSGFAHGFVVLSEHATFLYKCSDYYQPDAEHVLRWDDPAIGIQWPVTDVTVSDRDRSGELLDALKPTLPSFGR